MFALLDIRASGLSGNDFARALLNETGVATMPGESFGVGGAGGLAGWLRLSLTQPDAAVAAACTRIATFAAKTMGEPE
jgi:arginine:pyruvate transaminase